MVVNESSDMESVVVSGITCDQNEARITFKKVPDQPGISAKIFTPLAEAGILVDMIIQNTRSGGQTDLTFTVPEADFKKAREISERVAKEIDALFFLQQRMAAFLYLPDQSQQVIVSLQTGGIKPLGQLLDPVADGCIQKSGIREPFMLLHALFGQARHQTGVLPLFGAPVHMKGKGKKDHRLAGALVQGRGPGQVFVPVALVEAMKKDDGLLRLALLIARDEGINKPAVLFYLIIRYKMKIGSMIAGTCT